MNLPIWADLLAAGVEGIRRFNSSALHQRPQYRRIRCPLLRFFRGSADSSDEGSPSRRAVSAMNRLLANAIIALSVESIWIFRTGKILVWS